MSHKSAKRNRRQLRKHVRIELGDAAARVFADLRALPLIHRIRICWRLVDQSPRIDFGLPFRALHAAYSAACKKLKSIRLSRNVSHAAD